MEQTIRYFQKGFNFSQDGPGNRLVYHLCGCNLTCPWCSNPEGMDFDAPGRVETVDALEKYILSARPMFFEGGGVTLTGGECTLQFAAVKALLMRLHAQGVSTAIETNATHPRLRELFPLLDMLMADLKHADDSRHAAYTGQGNARIIENLNLAARAELRFLLRIPLIHHVNDDDASFEAFRAFFEQLNAREGLEAEVLRYHEYGKEKWEKSGKVYRVTDGFVDERRAIALEALIRSTGHRVVRT